MAASAATAIDAARARLDVEAPQIEVRVTGPAKHPQGLARHGGARGEWPAGQIWHFPRDEGPGKDLVVDLAVVITTHSDRPVHLGFEGDLYEGAESSEKATSFEVRPTPNFPGGTHDRAVTLRLRLTPGEWAQNYHAHAEGRPLPHRARGIVTAADYRDHGVVDTWECSFGAWPIEPVPDLAGQWRLI